VDPYYTAGFRENDRAKLEGRLRKAPAAPFDESAFQRGAWSYRHSGIVRSDERIERRSRWDVKRGVEALPLHRRKAPVKILFGYPELVEGPGALRRGCA
jgi:hypothetical protein